MPSMHHTRRTAMRFSATAIALALLAGNGSNLASAASASASQRRVQDAVAITARCRDDAVSLTRGFDVR